MTKWSRDGGTSRPISHRSTAPVVRGEEADTARNARFDVGFSRHSSLPDEVVERLTAEAQAAGYAAGWAEGRRAAERAARQARDAFATEAAAITAAQEARAVRVLGALAAAVDRFEQRATPAAEDMQAQLVDAAFALAESIIARELATAAEPGRDAIVRALAFAPPGRPAVARLSPADAATLPGTTVVDGRDVVVVADPMLDLGDAIVDCDATTIESRIDAALSRAREALS